jgi:FKBP-type peptidyl-prolyl cis-trans isomerase FklB
MKKLFFIFLSGIVLTASAQVKKTAPAAKTKAPVKVLKNLNDSASYAIGLSVINFYKQQGITSLNTALVSRAINDALANRKPLLTDEQANSCVMTLMNQKQEAKSKTTIVEGQKFLAQNKNKPGVQTTASGLQYEVITQGTGPKPTVNDSVEVNYVGTLINGNEFDNSYKRGQSITFLVTGVIKGWTEALQLMNAGSKYKLYIPYELAYGTNDVGNGSIPGGSVLVFEVELLRVVGKQ